MGAAYSVEQFVQDVGSILNEQGETVEAVWSIGSRATRLVNEGGLLASMSSGVIHHDPAGRFVVMLAHFSPSHQTPVHSHEGWGVLCLLSGSDHYTSWRRLGGSEAGAARLELLQEHNLEAGNLAYWFNEPHNIHRQSAGEKGCSELIVLKGQGRRLLHFDLEKGEAEIAPPRR